MSIAWWHRFSAPTGPLSYPDAKIAATNGASRRSAPAINPDERSGLAHPWRASRITVSVPQGCLEFREFGATALLVNLVTYFRVLAYPVVEGVAVEFCFKPPDFGLAKLD